MRVADLIMERIALAGVRTVFMVPGGGAMHLNDALGCREDMDYVCNLHEQASAVAAEAFSKMTEDLGVCLVTTGPGSTNALTGLVGAWLDSTPVLFIAGQVKISDSSEGLGVRSLGVQEVSVLPMVKSCTKKTFRISRAEDAAQIIDSAINTARDGRQGPVWVEVPLDVQAMPVAQQSSNHRWPKSSSLSSISTGEIQTLLKLIETSERPLIVVGNGARLAGCSERLFDLARLWNIPVELTWLAIDLLAEDDPIYIGRPGSVASRGSNFAVQNADLLISVGARLDPVLTAFAPQNFAKSAKKVIVDIDPNEINKLDMNFEMKLVCDAKDFVEQAARASAGRTFPARSEWWERCLDWRAKYPIVTDEHRRPCERISTYAFSEALANVLLGGETIVSGSSGSGIEIFLHAFKVKKGQRILHTTALGSMGFALPSIIGAYKADPGRRIVAVDGDGGFFFNIQELETIRRLEIPVKIFVLNNEGYSSIRNSQTYWFDGRMTGADVESGNTLPSITAVAEGFGIKTVVLEGNSDLDNRLRSILEDDSALVIDVKVIPDEPREPRVASIQHPDGSFESRPLEDLFPFLDREQFLSEMFTQSNEEGEEA